ncbi:MAG: GNAT family N-acetyltransferase [Clostridia bacterium]
MVSEKCCSVGVLSKFRGQGLARILMEKVLDEYSEYPIIFLFASDDVSDFYKKFEFMRIGEIIPYINVENNNTLNKPKNITLESDKINDLLNKNTQYSSIIDARGNPNIYWFHLLYSFKNCVYYIPEKDVLFIAKYRDNTVDLYDVISKNKIKFKEIESYILKKDINRVNFHFTPDWLDVGYSILPRDDNALYVYGSLDTDMTRARFPKTSTT